MGKTYKMNNLIKSILFNKIVSKFTWIKNLHLLHCYQIKLLRNIFGSNIGSFKFTKEFKLSNKIK